MKITWKSDAAAREEELTLLRSLAEQRSRLEGVLADLTRQRDRTAELRKVEDQLETARREQARLTEKHDREVREAEHKAGLLLKQGEQEVANARREATLEVREANLAREREAFTKELEFTRAQMQGDVERMERIMTQVLERLPDIQATFTKSDVTRPPRPVKEAKAEA